MKVTYAAAIGDALKEEMRRDGKVLIYGEDIAQFGNIFYVLRYFGIKFLFAERFSVRTRHLRFGEVGYYGFSVLETTYRRAKVCAAGIDEDFFAAFDFIPAYVAYVRRHHGNRAEAV